MGVTLMFLLVSRRTPMFWTEPGWRVDRCWRRSLGDKRSIQILEFIRQPP